MRIGPVFVVDSDQLIALKEAYHLRTCCYPRFDYSSRDDDEEGSKDGHVISKRTVTQNTPPSPAVRGSLPRQFE
jgi:hypothetical protein